MQTLRRGLLGVLLAFSAFASWAAAGPWEPVKQGSARDDINTWVRSVDGMAVKAFRGVVEVNQPVINVLALLADVPNRPNWVFKCAEAQHAKGFPDNHSYVRFKGVWPASPRDVMMRTVVTQQPDGAVLLETRDTKGYPTDDDFVRIAYLSNIFRLTPLKGGWTKVEFETQVDLGGMVPAWLANMVSTQAPFVTLDGLKREVAKPKYKLKSAAELPAWYFKDKPLSLPADH